MIIRTIRNFRNKFKKVHLTAFKQYFFFSIYISIILVLVVGTFFNEVTKIITSQEYINDSQKNFIANKIVKEDYKSIEAEEIKNANGWVEILDKNKNLIYVIGNKKDDKKKYTEEEFIVALNENIDIEKQKSKYYYSISSFNSNDKLYYCVVKIPIEEVDINATLKKSVEAHDKYIEKVAVVLLGLLLIFIIIMVILIFIYAFVTSRKIVKPLRKILEGIKKMTDGDYGTRIEFKADNEFSEIRDAFNFMAKKIEDSEVERDRVESLKSQLLLDISHDLKTPITSIQGYSKALNDGIVESEEKQKKYLNIIYDKSIRVTELIDNLHELTKLDSKGYIMKMQECDICEFARELLAGFYKEIEDKEFQLDVDIPEKELNMKFDKIEMSRAISNIISNAIKYNPNRTKVKIQIEENEKSIKILIADDGIGISENLKQNIFEPFTRGDGSRKSTGGTGLGLSISKKIIEKHGGILTLIESKEYKTIFKIMFSIDKVKINNNFKIMRHIKNEVI